MDGSLNTDTSGENQMVQLRAASKLDFRASEALAECLRERRGKDVTLDFGDVEQLGAHALQTLLVAKDSWKRDGCQLTCINPSDAVSNQLDTLGMKPEALFVGYRT